MTVEMDELEKFLNDDKMLANLQDNIEVDATLMLLLGKIVENQGKSEKSVEEFAEAIEAIKEFKIPVSQAELEGGLEAFQGEAIRAYQRIASSLVSIIEGELSALTTGVPGAFSFDEKDEQEIMKRKIKIFGEDKPRYEYDKQWINAYAQQIEDTYEAVDFMIQEIGLVKQIVERSSDKVEELSKSEAFLSAVSNDEAISNLMKATTGYLEILADTEILEKSREKFGFAKDDIKDEKSRAWGTHVIHGMCNFAKFAARFSEAEADLNQINQVDGAGMVRRALGRAFSDIILVDQKFYPANNQIPIPPVSVSPVIINTYLKAYEDRAEELATATEGQISQINNKFDRQIATAQRNANQLSETLLVPRPAKRSSIPKLIDPSKMIETPKAFFSRTTGIPLDEVDANLEERKRRKTGIPEPVLAEDAADTVNVKERARKLAGRFALGLGLPSSPDTRAPSEKALDKAGSNVMMANPRNKRRRKK